METKSLQHQSIDDKVYCNEILGEQENTYAIPSEIYISAVTLRAQSKGNGWLLNKGIYYAKLCVSELIRNTHKTLYIFNQKMNKAVVDTEEVYGAIKEAVYRGVEVRVVLEEDVGLNDQDSSKAIKFLLSAECDGEDVKVKTASPELVEKIKKALNSDYHFMVGDKHMVRIEIDKNDFKTIASYNEERYAPQLHLLIQEAFE